jgi:hypothetical protein
MKFFWISLLLPASVEAARPYYATESALASKLETQSEVVASPSTFSLPPLPSRFGAVVLEAMSTGDASKAAVVSSDSKTAAVAPSVSIQGLTEGLKSGLQAGPSSFQAIAALPQSELAGVCQQAQNALEMLLVSLESTGGGQAVFTSIAAKGAIGKWNQLVTAAVNRWQLLSRDRSGDTTEIDTIEAFLEGKQAEEVRNVLGAFQAI